MFIDLLNQRTSEKKNLLKTYCILLVSKTERIHITTTNNNNSTNREKKCYLKMFRRARR